MTPEEQLVQLFGRRGHELDAIRALAGGVTATELKRARLTPAAFRAVMGGLANRNPRVRWWCIQVLDHVPDERAMLAIADRLDDPVPRVRRNAAHALGCVACKPDCSAGLPTHVRMRLMAVATDDPNPKVRAEAALALACR
jgi:HEAT repeat protein